MKKIVLVRHGESVWNKENRFTGWADVDLTAIGEQEAARAGLLLLERNFRFSISFTSYMKRANKTLNIMLDKMNLDWIAVEKSWKLNGRHYGTLEGLMKSSIALLHGADLVYQWRRSYNTPPVMMEVNDPRAPYYDDRYKDIEKTLLPLGESLKDASKRILPYWEESVIAALKNHDEILVVSHGNTLRAIIKHVKNISDKDIETVTIPTAKPYVLEYDNNYNLTKDYSLE